MQSSARGLIPVLRTGWTRSSVSFVARVSSGAIPMSSRDYATGSALGFRLSNTPRYPQTRILSSSLDHTSDRLLRTRFGKGGIWAPFLEQSWNPCSVLFSALPSRLSQRLHRGSIELSKISPSPISSTHSSHKPQSTRTQTQALFHAPGVPSCPSPISFGTCPPARKWLSAMCLKLIGRFPCTPVSGRPRWLAWVRIGSVPMFVPLLGLVRLH